MESTQEVEVELEEIATVEEKENEEKENEEKENEEKEEEERNVYSSLSHPSEFVYGVASSTRSYTVNEGHTQGQYCVTELHTHCRSLRYYSDGLTFSERACACIRGVPVSAPARVLKTPIASPSFIKTQAVALGRGRIMYVKLCNFGKTTSCALSSEEKLQPDSDIHRKVRVYRIVSLVLFVICVLLLIVAVVLFLKLNSKQSCQTVDPADRSLVVEECTLEKCLDVYHLTLPHERSQCLCHGCDRSWLKFENSCFFLSKNRFTWHESRDECQKRGGDLAIITNERLQRYLTENGNLHYWIGLNQARTNQWTWNNNTVLTVKYWGDRFTDGDCALLAANESPERSWHQSVCSLSLHYICQKTRS